MAGSLDGRVAVVVGAADAGPASGLVDALVSAGAAASMRPAGQSFDDLHPDVVVFAHVVAAALVPTPVVELDPLAWEERCEAPIRAALTTAQAAYTHLRHRDGRLIFVCPAVALEGADGLVPLATAAEAQRMLAKSAARRWGREGITVNVVTVPVGGGADAARTAGAVHPAGGLAAAVVWLASAGAGAGAITGATIGADGGAVMAP